MAKKYALLKKSNFGFLKMRLYLVQINFGLGVQMAHCTPLATLLVLIIVGFVNCFATIANICGRQNIAHLFLQLFSSNITFIYMKMNLTIVAILKPVPLDMANGGEFNDIPRLYSAKI